MNVVVSDPKKGKAYSKKTDSPVFAGKKIGDQVDLSLIGLNGYTGKISGGSDKDGFPMKPTLSGTLRKKLLMKKGVGFRPEVKGQRKKKTVRGNVVDADIHQLNVIVTGYGEKPLEELMPKVEKEKKE